MSTTLNRISLYKYNVNAAVISSKTYNALYYKFMRDFDLVDLKEQVQESDSKEHLSNLPYRLSDF